LDSPTEQRSFSLSPRERVGVRGRTTRAVPGLHLASEMRVWFKLQAALLAVLLVGQTVIAQIPSAASGTGVNAAFMKLFSSVGAFTAKVETQVLDGAQNPLVRMPMTFASLDGKVRLEIDLGQVQSKDFTASTLATIKQAGMDRMVSIFRPDKRLTYLVYPGVQSYQELAQSKSEAEAAERGLKLEKSSLGKETLDGHPCVKNKVVVKSGKTSLLEAVTWNATDLKDFPIQIEMTEKDRSVRMHYTDVRFVKPDANQFEVPAAYGRLK
jgi:hypothetical protein